MFCSLMLRFVSDSELKNQFQTNFFGAVSLIRSLLPAFREQRSGHILNISSIAGVSPFAGFGAYNATKAALESVSDTLSQELKREMNIEIELYL